MRNRLTVLSLVSLFILNLNVYSQVQVITEAEYKEIGKIKEKTKDFKRIETTIKNTYKEGVSEGGDKLIHEYESSKRHRYVVYISSDNYLKKFEERLYYDGREFRQSLSSGWREIDRSNNGPLIKLTSNNTNLKQYTTGKTSFQNKEVIFFTEYVVSKYKNKLSFLTQIDYIDEEGRIVFSSYYRSEIFPANITYKSETTYNYNPKNLKIEIPKL